MNDGHDVRAGLDGAPAREDVAITWVSIVTRAVIA